MIIAASLREFELTIQLTIGTVVIVLTTIFHVISLVALAGLLKRAARSEKLAGGNTKIIFLLAIAVLFIIGIHTIEAWSWAAIYLAIGEFNELPQALYFSVVTLTSLGYGDITLSAQWQILGTFEAMGGLILFGASTAFLLGLMRKLFDLPD